MRFKTENGTWYRIFHDDFGQMNWERESETPKSGVIRNNGGTLVHWPILKIGEPAYLWDTTILPGMSAHCVETSLVVEIQE